MPFRELRHDFPVVAAPEPDGVESHVGSPGDLGVALAVGGGQDDPRSQGDLLGRGSSPQEGLKGVALLVGQFDGERLGSAHGGTLE